uniref:uncharacterized protein LOC120341291 n=1 Tax=Styela clava TaxID=7725 RepID=UPI00193A8F0F|nr:uncharacterized protein LOC120341291 [Styela clava]
MELFTLLLCIFVLLCFVIIYNLRWFLDFMRRYRNSCEATRDIGCEKPHWLLGHLRILKPTEASFFYISKLTKIYPKLSPRWLGPFVVYLECYHPDSMKPILATDEPKDEVAYRFLRPWIGDGLLTSSGRKWKRNRRLLTPAFHFGCLKQYMTCINNAASIMLGKWVQRANKAISVEISHDVSLMTLDNILRCILSKDSGCQLDENNEYLKAVKLLSEVAMIRLFNPLYHLDFIFYLTPLGRRYKKACQVAHDYSERSINERKVAMAESTGTPHVRDFLDTLLSAKDDDGIGLSHREICDEVNTFLFEGHDTVSSGISWAFYNLAANLKHQELCRKEVLEVLNGRKTVEWDDLPKFKYLSMCIKESMRLNPPVFSIARTTSKSLFCPRAFGSDQYNTDRKPNSGCEASRLLPKDFNVSLGIILLHRNPHIWKNPDMFDPERFDLENIASRSSHAYLPFSSGPRNCIGQNLAMNEMKVVLALALSQFYITVDEFYPRPEFEMHVVLRPKNGIHLKLDKILIISIQMEMYTFLLCIVALMFFVFFYNLRWFLDFMRRYRNSCEATRDIGCEKPHWLLGHLQKLKPTEASIYYAAKLTQIYPKLTLRWFGPFVVYLECYHPHSIKPILATDEPKDEVAYRFLRPWIGDGLLTSSGRKWNRNRRLLTPAFNFGALNQYMTCINSSVSIMLGKWLKKAVKGTSVEVSHDVSLMTLDNIIRCILSKDSGCQLDENNEYLKAVKLLSEVAMIRLFNPLYHIDFIFYLTSLGRRYKKACQVAHDYSERSINERRAAMAESTETPQVRDFLGTLLTAKDDNEIGLSHQEICDEVNTFLFGGHDTVSIGISWAFYNLATNLKHQELCRKEVLEVLNGRKTVEWDDLPKLKYLTMCIKESLRLNPSVFSIARKTSKPLFCPRAFGSDQYNTDPKSNPGCEASRLLPKDFNVSLGIILLHRNPHIWKDPDTFYPERFNPENIANRSSHAYLPFSSGPRNCMGKKLAMNIMKVVLALALSQFRITVDELYPKPEFELHLLLRPKNGIHLKLEKMTNV